MNRLLLQNLFFLALFGQLLSANAQTCIDLNVQGCIVVATVNTGNLDCFDPFSQNDWTWKLTNPGNNETITTQSGFAFVWDIAVDTPGLGGYQLCLDRNGVSVDCVQYVNCHNNCYIATDTLEYLECPLSGCKVKASWEIPALNFKGVEDKCKVIFRDVSISDTTIYAVIENVPVTWKQNPNRFVVSIETTLPYIRTCYVPEVVLKISPDWRLPNTFCDTVSFRSGRLYKCMACNDELCHSSMNTNLIVNAMGECEVFVCPPPEDPFSPSNPDQLRVTQNNIVIVSNQKEISYIRIIDIYGNVMYVGKNRYIDISQYNSGLYYITIKYQDQERIQQKFMKL